MNGSESPRPSRSVSVVIPAFNAERYLPEAIDSALNQTYPPLEVIVVDDGSTDGTADVIARYGDRIRAVRQENAGQASARNTAIRLAQGDLIALLDADDVWLPTKLERQIQRLEMEPDCGMIHCGMRLIDAEGNPIRDRIDGQEGWVAAELLLFQRPAVPGPGSTALIPRTVLETVGDFDENLSPSEDWELSYRIARRFRVAFIPEALVLYRQHGANSSRNARRQARAMIAGFEKIFRDPDPEIAHLRRPAYGKLHMILGASLWDTGARVEGLRHMLKSLWIAPENAAYIARFPQRALARRTKQRAAP